jgi:hypothetical protein
LPAGLPQQQLFWAGAALWPDHRIRVTKLAAPAWMPRAHCVRYITMDFRPDSAKLTKVSGALKVVGRGIQLCLLALGLLSVTPAALSCGSAAQRDCCPGGRHQPCNSGDASTRSNFGAPGCCAAAPAPLASVAGTAATRPQTKFVRFAAPQQLALATASLSSAQTSAVNLRPFSASWRPTPVAEPVYLLTRRLRL